MTIVTYTANATWTCPANVTTVIVRCWGAGQNGKPASIDEGGDDGGTGGAYAESTLTVIPGNGYSLVVPAGGSSTDTSFASSVIAECGLGGGSIVGSTGDIKRAGGAPGLGISTAGGGGGGGAGSGANGSNGATPTGGAGGTGTYPGGNGGNGGVSVANGDPGVAPGGGGGGAHAQAVARTGGAGARGEIVLEYYAVASTMLLMF